MMAFSETSSTLYVCFCLLCAAKHVVESCEPGATVNKSQSCVFKVATRRLERSAWLTTERCATPAGNAEDDDCVTSFSFYFRHDRLPLVRCAEQSMFHSLRLLNGGGRREMKVNKSSERKTQTADVTKRSGADVRLLSRRRTLNSESPQSLAV